MAKKEVDKEVGNRVYINSVSEVISLFQIDLITKAEARQMISLRPVPDVKK